MWWLPTPDSDSHRLARSLTVHVQFAAEDSCASISALFFLDPVDNSDSKRIKMEAFAFVDSGVTWGMPVKADVLVQQLQKYAQIRTLRLCHLFGRGPDAHVSKLPVEVRLLIENLVMESTSEASAEAAIAFYHFENKCEPVDHLTPEAYSDLASDMQRRFKLTICEECQADLAANVVLSCTSERCDCKAKVEGKMNRWLKDEPEIVADCETMAKRWRKIIDQEGEFAKYDEVSTREIQQW